MNYALKYKARPPLQVRKQSLTDKAYSAIKAEINAGHIPPDTFINLAQIEEQLEISRTPVREAMLRLQNEKLVEIVPKRGIRILPLSVKDLLEYYGVITGLEVQAVANICERQLTRTDIMPLLYALSSMENAIQGEDHEAWALADENFHRGLFILNGNKKLQEAGLFNRDIIQRAHFVALGFVSMADKMRIIRHHNEVKKLILAIDERSTRAIYLEHWKWTVNLIRDSLSQKSIEQI